MVSNADTEIDAEPEPKPVEWIGSSLRDLRRFPKGVCTVFGQALFDAQTGHKHPGSETSQGIRRGGCA